MKTSLDDLALFGGEPAFPHPLHVGRPHVGDQTALLARIGDALERRWFTNGGRYVEQLEDRIADYVGVKHCVATCNGTTALQITARACGLSGEVLVPAFTFVATAHALAWQGVTPVFCDIGAASHNLDPEAARRLITDRTTGIVGVHLWGRPCDVDALQALAREHDLRLIFDAAHAFGCSHRGRMIGGHGDAEVFSFHATKLLNAGEGGAIVTNDDDLAARARLMRNFGFADYDQVVSLGINGKMSEIAAAMGLTSLDSLDEFLDANRLNHAAYQAGLADIPGVSLVRYAGKERHNYEYAVVELDDGAGISRDLAHRVLWAENVLARRYFYPGVHRMEPYRSGGSGVGAPLPVTERLADRILVLPNGGDIDPADATAVCELLSFAIANRAEIDRRLSSEREV